MREGWRTQRLGELCDIVKGRKPKLKAQASEGDLPYLVAKVMRGTQEPEFAALSDRNSIPVSEDETIIICDGSNSGEVFTGFRGVLSSTMGKLVKKGDIDDAYLRAFLDSTFEVFNGAKTGAAIPHLDKEALYALPFSYPALSEQRRIVAILDEAFESIVTAKANAEKNLQNARELFTHHREALLAAQPGWREAPLAELCAIKHGYAFEGEFFSATGEHVLLTPGSFFEAGGYRERGEKTKYFVGPIPKDYVLSEGDLLVAMTEQAAGLLGSPLLVPESHRFLHNQRLGLVVGLAGVPWSNEFFFHVFNLIRVRQEIHASASGAKVRHTSPAKIGLVRVAYPDSVDEQRSIAAQLVELSKECDRLVDVYERKLAALDDLKKSLLHQAFSGQL